MWIRILVLFCYYTWLFYDENGNIIGVVVSQLNKLKVAKAIGSLPENVNFGIKASTVKQFLNSSGLPSSWSKRSKRMSTKDIAKIAENQTVMVMCHRQTSAHPSAALNTANSTSTLVIAPFLAYDQAMRCLAVITMLNLAMAMAQPVAAQSFKPDYGAGRDV